MRKSEKMFESKPFECSKTSYFAIKRFDVLADISARADLSCASFLMPHHKLDQNELIDP